VQIGGGVRVATLPSDCRSKNL